MLRTFTRAAGSALLLVCGAYGNNPLQRRVPTRRKLSANTRCWKEHKSSQWLLGRLGCNRLTMSFRSGGSWRHFLHLKRRFDSTSKRDRSKSKGATSDSPVLSDLPCLIGSASYSNRAIQQACFLRCASNLLMAWRSAMRAFARAVLAASVPILFTTVSTYSSRATFICCAANATSRDNRTQASQSACIRLLVHGDSMQRPRAKRGVGTRSPTHGPLPMARLLDSRAEQRPR